MPLHVPDDRGGRRVTEADQVIEVTADVHAVGTRQIPGGDREAGDARQRPRQKGLLQAVGQIVLGVVEQGAVHGLGDQPAQGDEDGTVAGAEGTRMVVGQDAAADPAVGHHQWEEGPGLLVAQRGGLRVVAGHLLGVGEEDRGTGAQHMTRGGEVGVQRQAVEAGDDARVVTPVPGDPQASRVGRGENHALGAEGGQDLVGHHTDHVGGGDGLAQRGRQVDQLVDPSRAGALRSGEGRADPGRRSVGRALVAVGGEEDADTTLVGVEPEVEPSVGRGPGPGAFRGMPAREFRHVKESSVLCPDGVVWPAPGPSYMRSPRTLVGVARATAGGGTAWQTARFWSRWRSARRTGAPPLGSWRASPKGSGRAAFRSGGW
ncbi:hypothetical protein SHO565_31070 [Streptomyces sp. HO565]